MKYNAIFIIICIFSSILGVLLGILNNNLYEFKDSKNENENFNKLNPINPHQKEEKGEKEQNERKELNERKDEKKPKKEKEKEEDSIRYKNKLRIAVSYATDNKYIYPTIVSMTSLVDKAGNNTFYDIYILHPGDFTEKSKNFLKSVEKNYYMRTKIFFLDMENKYKGLKLNFRIATPAYYRLSLHELLPDVKRIIYLDGDTLIFEDLTELIKLDMEGNVIMGFLDSSVDAIKNFGFNNATVVCSGVLLMDLEGLRIFHYSQKINDFINKNKGKLTQHDQTIINVVMQGQIAPIPPKYGIWAWLDDSSALAHLKKQRPWLKYNQTEFLEAVHNPAILHYIWPKPFWKKKTAFYDEWWNYASKTGFYNDIYTKSPIPKIKW